MHSDLALSRRLERAEGIANARFVETRARVSPESGAQWTEVAGTYAMFDGPQSPCTQTFGLGLFQSAAAAELNSLEAFFRDRGSAVFHEVSPLAGIAVVGMLHERGYRPVELSSVLYLPLDTPRREPAPSTSGIQVRVIKSQELELWARTAAAGWSDVAGFRELLADLMLVSAERRDMLSFLAELEGQAIAAGGLILHDGVALLAGASTIPAWRNRGAQRALFEARLAAAGRAGCELAMIVAEPGSASQRNAERQGFRIAYTRTKWCLGT